jgi:hypothetical protein
VSLEIFPEYNGHGYHTESEEKIFNRNASHPEIQKKVGTVYDDALRGKVPVYQKFEEEYDK